MMVLSLLAAVTLLLVGLSSRRYFRAYTARRRGEEAYRRAVDNRPPLFDWAQEGDL